MGASNRLWNKDFTIMTVGSVISMLGNSVAGFAIGLLMLDYTDSIFLYALTMVLYNMPKIFMPSLSGPFLDKFSRRKTMYVLDFISAALFGVIAIMSFTGSFSYAVILTMCIIIGTIDSIYMIAYESLFPLLISKENYTKAYSISAVIGNISQIALFVAPIVYYSYGTAPLFAFNAVTFLVAAIFETMIRANESQVQHLSEKYNIKSYANDFKIGLRYLLKNKGLLYIVLFYVVLMSAGGMSSTLVLPFFKNTEGLGVTKFVYIIAGMVAGRLLGSGFHYTKKVKDSKKYLIAIIAFFSMTIVDGTYMFTNLPIMIVCMFISGLMTVTTYNLRMSSTQSYVPNEMRARFNGTFQTLTMAGGSIFGLVGGALADLVPIPYVVLGGNAIVFIAIFVILIRNKKEVKRVYNHEF